MMCSAYELYAAAGDLKADDNVASERREIDVQSQDGRKKKQSSEGMDDMCSRFKQTFSRKVKVHFVGAWFVRQYPNTTMVLMRNLSGIRSRLSGWCEVKLFQVQQTAWIMFVFFDMPLPLTNVA